MESRVESAWLFYFINPLPPGTIDVFPGMLFPERRRKKEYTLNTPCHIPETLPDYHSGIGRLPNG